MTPTFVREYDAKVIRVWSRPRRRAEGGLGRAGGGARRCSRAHHRLLEYGMGWLVLMGTVLSLWATRARAEDLVIPAQIEAQFIVKLLPYDRSFLARAGERVVIAILVRASQVDSARAASQIQQALAERGPIGGLSHEEVIIPWSGPKDLAEICAKRRLAMIYLAPGLDNELGMVAAVLDGKNVLTVASVLHYVGRGAVLGFDLVSGRTKMVIDLVRAKKQGVMFGADVLKLMRVVE